MGDSAYYEGELWGNTPYPCIWNLPCASRSFFSFPAETDFGLDRLG